MSVNVWGLIVVVDGREPFNEKTHFMLSTVYVEAHFVRFDEVAA